MNNIWYDSRAMTTSGFIHHKSHQFYIGSVGSRNFNIIITDMRVFSAPERDVSFQSVAGRHGDILYDNNRVKNVEIVYSCAIPTDFREYFAAFKRELYSAKGYQKIVDTTEPGVFRMGIVHKAIEPTVIRQGNGGTFDVRITCKPQVFYEYGTILSTYSESPVTLYNEDFSKSNPLITVYGTGPGTLTIGEVTVEILALTDQITIDCDLMNAYRQVGDAAAENKNSDIYAPEFPVLTYGENVISWDGGITHIDLIPRWWRV